MNFRPFIMELFICIMLNKIEYIVLYSYSSIILIIMDTFYNHFETLKTSRDIIQPNSSCTEFKQPHAVNKDERELRQMIFGIHELLDEIRTSPVYTKEFVTIMEQTCGDLTKHNFSDLEKLNMLLIKSLNSHRAYTSLCLGVGISNTCSDLSN